ncbi:hypothetical protein QAD02_008444 [Eretmocerus hayati]|uniref:Uncharacterized protein n=1 Tax=Eretmocerus hayati TaxID=131215 RepID=A0ACC2N6J2_9HYME|nr:hypothetical protein QAD02_008444 [Eretmocerus hayati]
MEKTSRATNERFLSFVIESISKEPVEDVERARLMYQRQGYVSMEPCHSGAAALNDAIRSKHSAQEEQERVGAVNSHDPLRFGNRYPLYQCIPQFASGDKITEHLYNKNKATTVRLQAASLLSRGDELLVEDATHSGHKLAEKESCLIMARGLIDGNWGMIESPMYSMNEELFYNSLHMAVHFPKQYSQPQRPENISAPRYVILNLQLKLVLLQTKILK